MDKNLSEFKKLFEETERENPNLSTFINFGRTLYKSENISKKELRRYFDIFIDPNDYDEEDKELLIKHFLF